MTTVEVFRNGAWEALTYGSFRIDIATSDLKVAPEASVTVARDRTQPLDADLPLRIVEDGTTIFEGRTESGGTVSSNGQVDIDVAHAADALFSENVTFEFSSAPSANGVLSAALSNAERGDDLTLNFAATDITLESAYTADNRSVKAIFRDVMDRTGYLWWVDPAGGQINIEPRGGRGTWQALDAQQDAIAIRSFESGNVETVRNDVTVTATGGEAVTASDQDGASIAAYGKRSEEFNIGYAFTGAEAQAYATELLIPEPLPDAKFVAGRGVGAIAEPQLNGTVDLTDAAKGIDETDLVIEQQTIQQGRATFRVGAGAGVSVANVNREAKSREDKSVKGQQFGSDALVDGSVGSDQLVDGSVLEQKLADLSVSLEKVQDGSIDTGKLVDTAVIEEKIADAGVSEQKLQDLSVSLQKVQDDAIDTVKITNNAIETPKIAASAVTASEILAGTITANEIAAGTITANEISAGTITASEIAAGTISATEIAAGAITANEISAGTITASEIAAGTITTNEIAVDTITANNIASGTITATELAANTITANEIDTLDLDTGQLTISDDPSNPSAGWEFSADQFGVDFRPFGGTSTIGDGSSVGVIYVDTLEDVRSIALGNAVTNDGVRVATGNPSTTVAIHNDDIFPEDDGVGQIGRSGNAWSEVNAGEVNAPVIGNSVQTTFEGDLVDVNRWTAFPIGSSEAIELKDDGGNAVIQPTANQVNRLGTLQNAFNTMRAGEFITDSPEPLAEQDIRELDGTAPDGGEGGVDLAELRGASWYESPPEYVAAEQRRRADAPDGDGDEEDHGIGLATMANYLLETVKELNREREAQQERMDALEERLAALEGDNA